MRDRAQVGPLFQCRRLIDKKLTGVGYGRLRQLCHQDRSHSIDHPIFGPGNVSISDAVRRAK